MKNKLFTDAELSPFGGQSLSNRALPDHRRIRQMIRRQVMIDYETELAKSTGWQRFWIQWKLKTVA